MRYTTLLILITIISFLSIGQSVYQDNPEKDIYNITNQIEWDYNYTEIIYEFNNSVNIDISNMKNARIQNIIYKFVDFIGYTAFEVAKFGIELGFEHPEFNYYQVGKIIIIIIWLVVISLIAALSSAFIPIIALIYITYKWIRDFIRKRKEKKLSETD